MKRLMSFVLVFLIVLSIAIPSFAGNGELGKTHGQALFDLGIISGSGGDIKEADLITREEMVTILTRLLEGEDNFIPPATPTFKDVPSTHWAYKDIELAFSKGLTSGLGNGNFGLGDKINNNQAALFLLRSLGHDTSDIDYNTAASVIGEKHGLMLATTEEGSKQLIRGQVFELLAKALNMPTKDNPNMTKVDLLKYKNDGIQSFKNAMKNSIPFKAKKVEPEIIVNNKDFKLKDQIKYDKQAYLNYIKDNPTYFNVYEEVEKETKGMKIFVNKYLSGKYTKLELTDALIEKMNNYSVSFVSHGLDKYEEYYNSISNHINLNLLRDEDGKKVNMNSHVDSSEGYGGSGGYVTEIREYQDVANQKVYAILGKEEAYIELPDGTWDPDYKDFYFAFVVNSEGNVVECIGSTIYGQGYFMQK